MSSRYDAIIVGAGPAGSAAAMTLGRQQHRVLLVDAARFPREKVCGDAISRTKAARELRALGLESWLAASPEAYACPGLVLHGPGGARVALAGRCGGGVNRVITRRAFDAALLDGARRVTTVREDFQVTGLERAGEGVRAVIGHAAGSTVRECLVAPLVIGADGCHSVVARDAGLRPGSARGPAGIALRGYATGVRGLTNALELFFLDGLLPGYLWVFPCGDGSANVGVGLFHADLQRMGARLDDLFHRLLRDHPQLSPRFSSARWCGPLRGWPLPFWHRRQRVSSDGVLLAGDAAWLVDPVTGEGIGNALVSGRLAAETACEALRRGDVSAAQFRRYDRRLWRELGFELRLARLLQRALRHRRLVEAILTLAATQAWAGRLLANLIEAPEGKQSLRSPAGWARVLTTIPEAVR